MFQRDDFSTRLLELGVKPGMRVLDVGCGNGEFTRLAAEVLGANGQLIGIDQNSGALSQAKGVESLLPIQYLEADIAALPFDKASFDAIIGRRVLMYQKNPLEILAYLRQFLKPGGILLFQESDAESMRLKNEQFTQLNQAQEMVWETVAREGGHIHIGSQLYGMMAKLDLQVEHLISENVLQTKETGTDLGWLLDVMRGRISQHFDMGQLDTANFQTELETVDQAFVRDIHYGIVGRNV